MVFKAQNVFVIFVIKLAILLVIVQLKEMHILEQNWFGFQKLTMKDPKLKGYQILFEKFVLQVPTNIKEMHTIYCEIKTQEIHWKSFIKTKNKKKERSDIHSSWLRIYHTLHIGCNLPLLFLHPFLHIT